MRMMEKLSEVAIRSSYFIYTRRNKRWVNPESLKFCNTLCNYYFTCE